MTFRTRVVLPVSVIAAASLALAGCTSDDGGGGASSGDDSTLQIVASTNVYADIAATIAGDAAEVTAIIHDAAQDPHEYEATSRDALAIADADLVIINGGGYDEFMHTLLEAHDALAVVLDAVALSGLDADDHDADDHADEGEEPEHEDAEGAEHDHHAHGEFNEHVWYSFDAMASLADELASRLGELDPEGAATFTANADEFSAGLDALVQRASGIAAAHPHTHVAITEPVPLYLLEAAGLENVTPDEFSEAVEEGTDAPALVVRDTIELVADGSVAFLAYNEQTVGPQTEQVLAAAREARTPVLSFTELLPDGDDYLGWMGANLDAVETALR
jgi:zinc/manganese transport system substrate-binding protein